MCLHILLPLLLAVLLLLLLLLPLLLLILLAMGVAPMVAPEITQEVMVVVLVREDTAVVPATMVGRLIVVVVREAMGVHLMAVAVVTRPDILDILAAITAPAVNLAAATAAEVVMDLILGMVEVPADPGTLPTKEVIKWEL